MVSHLHDIVDVIALVSTGMCVPRRLACGGAFRRLPVAHLADAALVVAESPTLQQRWLRR